MTGFRAIVLWAIAPLLIGVLLPVAAAAAEVSESTETCLECHRQATPGIVADWEKSRHSRVSPAEALKKPAAERRFSAEKAPDGLAETAVGCAECHNLNPDGHPDTFDHEGEAVHVVVTPKDCAECHPVEAAQYDKNKMSRAYGILLDNPLYQDLAGAINRQVVFDGDKLTPGLRDPIEEEDSCLQCHGTKVEVTGTAIRETDLGDFEVPLLSGWPNQGTGRINPDQSRGSCASCHPRHSFSIKIARQPYTCAQCHKGPDVPAYKVYMVSKHGNIFSTDKDAWSWDAVPWTVGRDFTAPACAACHASLIVDGDGEIIAERTHEMVDRLPWRLFGLPYAHPQPKDPDTAKIRNKAGLPLPTEFSGEPAPDWLIDGATVAKRTAAMQKVCLACHSTGWTQGHWSRILRSIEVTNASTKAATDLINKAWGSGAAKGPDAGESPFDEAIERLWVRHWLFYANTTRLATAMGGTDYGVFASGRWSMSKNLQEMLDWLGFKTRKE